MAHMDRRYEIIEDLTGGPPNSKPVLGQNGHAIPPTQLLVFNKSVDRIKKVDHYRIRFDIKQFSQSPLRFTPSPEDVLWVKRGTGAACPTSRCQEMLDAFWVDEMDPDGGWIDVINMDLKKEDFWFTLNLVPKTDPSTTNFIPVDPGGSNQNNGLAGSFERANSLAVFAAGVAAGVVAFGGVQLLLNSR